jgi:hypothetical protein
MKMKKLLLIVAIAVSSIFIVNAQAFKNGDMVGNLGIGFGWYGYGYGATSLPAFSLSLEKGIKDIDKIGVLSVGGIVGWKHASYSWATGYDDFTWNDYIIAARGAIHMDLLQNSKLDTYGGIALGVRIQSYDTYDVVYNGLYDLNYKKVTKSETNGLFAIYVGGRYFFTDNLAGFGELGYGLGYLTLGVSYKF